jgi:hypothetical protein
MLTTRAYSLTGVYAGVLILERCICFMVPIIPIHLRGITRAIQITGPQPDF